MAMERPVVVAQPIKCRSSVSNQPLRRANGRTREGRRTRDIYRALLAALGNPDDLIVQANCLQAAELAVLAEQARVDLAAGAIKPRDLVRLSNLADRATARLGIGRPLNPGHRRVHGVSLKQYLQGQAP